MLDKLLEYGLQYTGYILEVGLFVLLLRTGQWKRLWGISVYVVSLVAIDVLARPYFLYHYGRRSDAFFYVFFVTDVLLALEAFGLLCILFRRACSEKWWNLLRLWLVLVFVGVVAISYLSISHNYGDLRKFKFIYEFEQNLFFACLVLNTLLYVMLQYVGSTDEQLGLLVCGMGIQFAGPTVGLALVHLASAYRFDAAKQLSGYLGTICTLGTLLIWIYTVRRFPMPEEATYRASGDRRGVPALAGVSLRTD